jgi:hypothetical protein
MKREKFEAGSPMIRRTLFLFLLLLARFAFLPAVVWSAQGSQDVAAENRRADGGGAINADSSPARRADADIASGKVFRLAAMKNSSVKALSNYLADGSIGARARKYAPLFAQMDSKAFLSFMQKDANVGRCLETVGKKMRKWQYPDGTLIRYKPQGDTYRQEPLYSVEVMRTPGGRDQSSDDVAFKVDPLGRPVPKGPEDVDNPYSSESAARQAYLAYVMEAGHRAFGASAR